MGYMNYYLKDIDIIERRNYQSTSSAPYFIKEKKNEFICPYCQLMFYDIESLYDHVKKEHYISECTLIVNSKVLSNDTVNYLIDIDSFYIVLYKKTMKIYINNKLCNIDDDIEGLVRKKFAENGEVKIQIGKLVYTLKRYSVELIDMKKIAKYIDKWNDAVVNSKTLVNIYDDSLNEFEKRYLDGMYNYFIATTTKNGEKGNRYMDAYGILNQFNPINAQGLMILKIVSFRLNWIDMLSSLSLDDADSFNIISSLYNGNKNYELPKKMVKENQIYIEDEILLNIKAIEDFAMNRKKDVDRYLNEIVVEDIDDINLRDRVLLLKALRCIDKGKKYRYYTNDLVEKRFLDIVEQYKEDQ